ANEARSKGNKKVLIQKLGEIKGHLESLIAKLQALKDPARDAEITAAQEKLAGVVAELNTLTTKKKSRFLRWLALILLAFGIGKMVVNKIELNKNAEELR